MRSVKCAAAMVFIMLGAGCTASTSPESSTTGATEGPSSSLVTSTAAPNAPATSGSSSSQDTLIETEGIDINDLSPRFSPSGERLIFQSDRLGSGDLYELVLATGLLIRLTSLPGTEADPTYASDGSVVFVYRPPLVNGFSLEHLVNSEQRQIIGPPNTTAFPDVSEDNVVAHACGIGGGFDICVINLDGTNPLRVFGDPLAREWQPVWSPDGLFLAYVSDADGDDEIYIADMSTAEITQLTNNESKDADPAWSPDGTQIAFTLESANVGVINIASGEVTVVAPGAKPDWSPDGRFLAMHVVPSPPELGVAIGVVNLETGDTVVVSRGDFTLEP